MQLPMVAKPLRTGQPGSHNLALVRDLQVRLRTRSYLGAPVQTSRLALRRLRQALPPAMCACVPEMRLLSTALCIACQAQKV